jgi:hypothetical protein
MEDKIKKQNYACKARCTKNLKIRGDTRISKETFQETSRGRINIVDDHSCNRGKGEAGKRKNVNALY